MMIKARYIVPVDGPVIENGSIIMDGGRIAAVAEANELHGRPTTDYGDAVVFPGFVNAHTHLELTSLAGRIPPGRDFVGWLREIMATIAATEPSREGVQESVRAGVCMSLACGVTLVGDITRHPGWTREALASSPLRATSFGEVIAIGSRRHLLAERLDAAADSTRRSERLRIGISPHAPYTVEPDVMRACALRADAVAAALCIHLAESADEESFTRACEGSLVRYLQDLGVWDDAIRPAGCSPAELASQTGLLGRRTVIAHANYVSDSDIDLIAGSGASVCYCPRTHDAFGHRPHRFRDMLAAGINVCLGTDSLASSPSLSILDELRFLRRRHPDLAPEQLIAMGTLHGSRALGLERESGSLSTGKAADLAVIPLDATAPGTGWASVFESERPPAAVYVSGRLQDTAP
jgi:cytosine/adenosine deaminase-related metal-dependent hydrolase